MRRPYCKLLGFAGKCFLPPKYGNPLFSAENATETPANFKRTNDCFAVQWLGCCEYYVIFKDVRGD